ncbi:MAG: ABC transporter permease, partial [Candidatus Acidiferrales bacterium]
ITLALGIGANTAIFSVVNGVLLKPLPFPHPEQLVAVWLTAPGNNIKDLNPSPSTYFVFRDQNHSFQHIGLYEGYSVNITGVGQPEHVAGLVVTNDVLPTLGISPKLGRWFTRADDSPGSADTVMLTYGYWHRKFGGDQTVLGRAITIDGESCEIIGVMPKEFHFGGRNLAVILPMKLDRNKTVLGQFHYYGIARLKPGVTLARANADAARMIPILLRSFPPPPGYSLKLFEDLRIGPNLRPLKQAVVGDVGKLLWVLMGGIGLVLLIACANVANLLLVRTEGRQRELAIRSALGASRARIAAEMLLESLSLALFGGMLGIALAYGALRILVAMAPGGLPRLNEISIDGTVLLFTLAVLLLASLFFGSIPVLKYVGKHIGTGLHQGGRAMTEGRERHRSRNLLVIAQVALALVLLISSGLMVRTFRALIEVNPGFVSPSQIQTFRVDIPETDVKDPVRVVRMEQGILQKIEAIPGVSSVGLSRSVPMDGDEWRDRVLVRGHTYASGDVPLARYRFIAPSYFKTLGTPIIAGRDITWSEIYNEVPVAMVSEKLAREYWDDPANALGKQIRSTTKDDWREIVGVVGNIHDDGMNKPVPSS